MIDYTLSSLSERLDSSFLISSWLPAFIAVLANLGLLTVLVGPDALAAWLSNLDAFEETILAVMVLVVVTVLALLFRALSVITAAFFVGELLPRVVAEWSTRGQQRNRARALAQLDDDANGTTALPLHVQVRRLVEQRYPQDESALRPTRLGNVLATAVEYPWIVYAMDGLLWFPHLWPALPSYMSDPLDAAQSRLLGLLNLSLVCGVVAIEAVLVFGLASHQWVAAVLSAVVGALLARFCYQAAVNQSLEVVSQIRVAFNLYRHEILKQLGSAIPDTVAAEKALWQALTKQLLGQPLDVVTTGDRTETAACANGEHHPAAADHRTA